MGIRLKLKCQLLPDSCICSKNFVSLVQVDTPGKKLLVGVAVGYLALVLVVPTLNVFAQVNCCCHIHQPLLQCL